MREKRTRQKLIRGTLGVVLFLAAWEIFAYGGGMSAALTPPLELIVSTFFGMLADGTLLTNAGATLLRVFLGLGIAFLLSVPLGILMARNQLAKLLLLPIVTVLMPIPSLAWVPLFILWLGIGDAATILVVVYAAFFPLVYNVWAGVRAVNPLWIRAAVAMGAGRLALFRGVIWPGSLPYIITGARLAFGRSWIGVIGGELLSSPTLGLGKVIFDAREFLNASVMLAVLVAIGAIALLFERLIFEIIELRTVAKWGTVTGQQ